MTMKKAMVIGCSGAGKSTFSRKLRDKTGLPLYHLDMIWHKPDKTHVTREEFDARLGEILTRGEWILDGDYSRTMETRLQACDTVFLFDLPIEECLAGVESRIGKPREDMPWREEAFDEEFRQWILTFPTEKTPRTYELLKQYEDRVKVVIFHSRAEADAYIDSL